MDASEPVSAPGKIVSDGQTSSGRGALDWAVANGVPHGGWYPKGHKAEDGCAQATRVAGAALLRDFFGQHGIRVLNVAESRASEEPKIGAYVKLTLDGIAGVKGQKLWQTRNT